MIFGDFNSDLNINTHDSTHLRNFVDISNLHLVPYSSTHHVRDTSTLLDLCIIDDKNKLLDYGQFGVPFLSAHDLIFVKYKIAIDKLPQRVFTCRDFRKFNQDAFLRQLASLDWAAFYSSNFLDEKVWLFNNYLELCYNVHAPITEVRSKKLPAPWLTPQIKAEMKSRDTARREWKRRRRDNVADLIKIKDAHDKFKRLRNSVQDRVRAAKSEYYNRIFSTQTCASSTWTELRNLGLIKSRKSPQPLATSVTNLNEYFASAGIDPTYRAPLVYHLGNSSYSDQKFYFKDISYRTLDAALKSSKSSAVGVDGLTISMIKLALPCIRPMIHHIFSFSLQSGVFPTVWKSALVTPLPKVKSPASSNDYRPISILCALSKSLEKIVFEQMMEHLNSQDLLDPQLTGRLQSTKDQHTGVKSDWVEVRNGVPQGSVLGPLLFVLFISTFRGILSHCKYNFYADDLQIFLDCKPDQLVSGIRAVNDDIRAISIWASEMGLLLNEGKTKAIVVGTRRFIANIPFDELPSVIVGNVGIPFSTEVVCLGITISNTLSWSSNTTRIAKRVNSILYQLKLCRGLLPHNLRVQLISTLVFPHLDYCSLTYLDLTNELDLILSRSLNACIRFSLDIRRDEHITEYYRQLKWLKTRERRLYFLGCLTFKILASHTPKFLFDRLALLDRNQRRNTRRPKDWLHPPSCRTELFKHSFTGAAPHLWNNLPPTIRQASKFAIFKKLLYQHLLAQI